MPKFEKVIVVITHFENAYIVMQKNARFKREYIKIMTAQTSLFDITDYIDGKKLKTKRVHYKKPAYIKSYSFWHVNPDTNEIQFDGDEKHIFRIRVLHRIYSILYGYCNINLFEQFEKREMDGLIIWQEDRQAEIANTSHLPIRDRVLLHIKLLRLLREGFSVKEALEKMKGK